MHMGRCPLMHTSTYYRGGVMMMSILVSECRVGVLVWGSSNVNEVIRKIPNLFLFFTKRFSKHKKHKTQTTKRISDFFPLRCFLNGLKRCLFCFCSPICVI